MKQPQKVESVERDAPPPILGTWRRLYWVVLLIHAFLLIVFYWVTKYFS